MNLRDLKYLVVVSETRSFVKAAQQCFVSQPTLSTQIKKIEQELGVLLFERTNKKVMVTTVGRDIIESAQAVLDEVERMKRIAANATDPFAGDLRLGAFPSLASYLFPDTVMTIKQSLPNIKLILIEEKTHVLIEQLASGEIDAAFLSLPLKEEFLESAPLFDDAFELAVAVDHSFASKRYVEPTELQDQPLLLLDEGHCMRDQALQFCQWSGAAEHLGVRAASLETLRQMVIAGTGMTLIPEIASKQPVDAIRYIPFSEPKPKRTIGLVWRKSSVRVELMMELVDLFKR